MEAVAEEAVVMVVGLEEAMAVTLPKAMIPWDQRTNGNL